MRKPNKKEINLALNSFSKNERILFFSLIAVFIASSLIILNRINNHYMVEVPAVGGSLTEGVVGEAPRFINPLLATSDADRDLSHLIYSGLLRVGADGKYIGDLAEGYSISADGLTYTFNIKKNAVWQDGKPVTSDDVEFTIEKAVDPNIKSYRRPSFEGVTVKKLDDKTVTLKLKQPYSPFLENATMGILPKHIWSNIDASSFSYSKFNLSPIGSGPYKIKSISSNNPPDYYDLAPFQYFTLGQPKIENLRIRFYQNEDALLSAFRSGEITAINTIPPETAKNLEAEDVKVIRETLPRIFAIFFNQNRSKVLADKAVRTALNVVADKNKIVKNTLLGYGIAIDGPLPIAEKDMPTQSASSSIESAAKILKAGGWKLNPKRNVWEKIVKKTTMTLSFDLATSDTPELKNAATEIAKEWRSMGAEVNLRIFEIGDLNQNVIRPRNYDAIFFGEVIGRNPDLFSFWHSSQRNDPGLNISMYANSKADKLLESARVEQNPDNKMKKYAALQTEIGNDLPAIFIYSPDFLYAIPRAIKNININNITIPSDRFTDIYNWYMETDKVWKIFANN